MDAQFISIVERLAREKGQAVLIDAVKCKAHLADYTHNAFKKERHLLLIAIEAGAGKEIARAGDLAIGKKQLIRFLNEERFIDETLAAEAIDLLALVLRGDQDQSVVVMPNSQSQPAATQQQSPTGIQQSAPAYNPSSQGSNQQIVQPHSPAASVLSSLAHLLNNIFKSVLAFLAGLIVFGACALLGGFIFFEVFKLGDTSVIAWVVCLIAGLMAGVPLWIKLTPREVKDGLKHWIKNW
jgi:hypothetical protein